MIAIGTPYTELRGTARMKAIRAPLLILIKLFHTLTAIISVPNVTEKSSWDE
jgi:hypothetical protein